MRMPAVRIWLLSAFALLGVAAARRPQGFDRPLRLPSTPLDRTSASGTREWAFLEECAKRIPRGASLTALAREPDVESALFMLALGIFPDHAVWPSSYFGTPSASGARAEYVLIYRDAPRPPGLEIVEEWEDGAVGRRRPLTK